MVTLFITKALVPSSQNPWYPLSSRAVTSFMDSPIAYGGSILNLSKFYLRSKSVKLTVIKSSWCERCPCWWNSPLVFLALVISSSPVFCRHFFQIHNMFEQINLRQIEIEEKKKFCFSNLFQINTETSKKGRLRKDLQGKGGLEKGGLEKRPNW